jgi:hypothetical protein
MKNTNTCHIVLLVYNSYGDPLCRSFFMSYIRQLCQEGRVFHLITFEQPAYAMTVAEQNEVRSALLQSGIHWYPLTYKSGRLMLIRKLMNFLEAFFKLLVLRMKYKPSLIISLANIAGIIGHMTGGMLGIKTCILSFEPHSEFLADFGLLHRRSLRYRLLHFLEMRAGRKSDFIITGTIHMEKRLKENSSAKVYRAPSAIDGNVFYFDPEARQKIRTELRLESNDRIAIYAGKTGGLYLQASALAAMMVKIKTENTQWHLLIVSPDDPHTLREAFLNAGANPERLHIRKASSPQEMRGYYSCADVGVSAVPSLPSQLYRSPVKVGEYLFCGLPYLTFPGVSEDDLVAKQFNVGSVLGDDFFQNLRDLEIMLAEPPEKLRSRCRMAGESYRGMQVPINLLNNIIHSACA